MVNFITLLLRKTVSGVMAQAAAALAPTARRSTARYLSTSKARHSTPLSTTLAQSRRQYQTHQQFKQQLKREQQELAQNTQMKTTSLSKMTPKHSLSAHSVPQSVAQPIIRQSLRQFSIGGNGTRSNLMPKKRTDAVSVVPETPAAIPDKPTGSLYSRIDDKLVSAGTVATAQIKRKLPRGKIIFYTILILGTYYFFQNRIMRNSTRWVNQNVINMKRKQIMSLKEIASLSVEDIFHVFQTIYPELTSNGMLPIDRISHAIYDEIDDGRDDRKIAENKLRNLVTVFVHDSHIHFARLDQLKAEKELDVVFAQIQQNLPPNTAVEFDKATYELNLKMVETKAEEGAQNAQNAQTGDSPATPVPPVPTLSDTTDPLLARELSEALAPTNQYRSQVMDQMEQLVLAQQSLFGRLDITPEQRQSEVGKIQENLVQLQQQLSTLEDQQHHIRAAVYTKHDQILASPADTSLFPRLMDQYGQIFTQRKASVDIIATNKASQDRLIAELPEAEQASTLKYLEQRAHAERTTPSLDHTNVHIHNAKDRFLLTALDLNPETMPTLEDAYSYNYYQQDNDEYKISTWTMLALFKNLPTGTAGDDRYVKFHEAIVASSLLAKTQWSPSDPHHPYYVKPDILRQYKINVQRAFRDYVDDPLCAGGIVSLEQFANQASVTLALQAQHQNSQKNAQNDNTPPTSTPAGQTLSPLEQFSQSVSNFFTIPKSISSLYTSEAAQLKNVEEEQVSNFYEKLHFEQLLAKMVKNGQDITKLPPQLKFEPVYKTPLENRLAIVGQIVSRHHPDCDWDSIPLDVRTLIAERFEHLRLRKLSQFSRNYDYNPREPIRLAWASMFPPDPLPDTPASHNQYRRALGGYDEQMKRVERTLGVVSEQPLSRTQFEKLITTMCNAGHFKSRTALLTRTNRIWPIAYHTTSPQVIAQAYYDVLDKEVDDQITLDEFHKAASHWGKVGRYNIWYYAPEYQGQGDKISAAEKSRLKWGERVARFCYNWTGVPDWLSNYITNTPNGKLNLKYLDLQERFIETKIVEPKKEFTTKIHTNHFNNQTNLSHFSAHSRNVTTELLGETASSGAVGKKQYKDRKGGDNDKDGEGSENNNESEPSAAITITTPQDVQVASEAPVVVAEVEPETQSKKEEEGTTKTKKQRKKKESASAQEKNESENSSTDVVPVVIETVVPVQAIQIDAAPTVDV